MRSRHISVVIHRPPGEVYEYAVDPDNLPRWAAGLASSEVTRESDAGLVQADLERLRDLLEG